MVQDAYERGEYKVLKLDTHRETEKTLNEMTKEGWEFVSYQTASDGMGITHFVILRRRTI